MTKKVGFRVKRGEKMTHNYINSNKIKENKYKILRMSLILGSDENRAETVNNFEESAREIDAMNDETYLRELEGKFYDTLKLEEEEKKLATLVDYIGGRVEQRISLLSDFANITGYDLSNLPPIKYYDKLDDYKERLKYIREYLSNTEQINKLTVEIDESEQKLKEAYVSKATFEEHNNRNEEIILSKFINIIKPLDELNNITPENIDARLNSVISSVEESKKSLDIFVKSYTTLRGSGISYEEETEYKSYVDNAKEVFYSNKEQEYLLKIYNLLLKKESEYNQITIKRDNINEILYERIELRKELEIEENDILNPIYNILESQSKDIEQQKVNIETIEYLNSLIETKKEERNNLEQSNQKVEILSLLREFCIIDTYNEIEESITNEVSEPVIEQNTEIINDEPITTNNLSEAEEIIIPQELFIPNNEPITSNEIETIKDNQVTAIESATNFDLELIQSKASKVMKRVGEVLGIKPEETEIVSVVNEEEPATKENSIDSDTVTSELNNPLPDENPLFSNNITELNNKTPDPEDDNSFWFPSDMPDALNALPDLEVSNNNFFGNDSISDLNFPDLKIDFGPNDTEEN